MPSHQHRPTLHAPYTHMSRRSHRPALRTPDGHVPAHQHRPPTHQALRLVHSRAQVREHGLILEENEFEATEDSERTSLHGPRTETPASVHGTVARSTFERLVSQVRSTTEIIRCVRAPYVPGVRLSAYCPRFAAQQRSSGARQGWGWWGVRETGSNPPNEGDRKRLVAATCLGVG